MARNIIYNINWSSPKTGYDYRLTLTGADTTAFVTPVYTNVDMNGMITDMKFNFEFDKYRNGFPKAPSLEITFDLEKTPAAIQDYIVEPFVEQSFNYEPSTGWQTGTSIPIAFRSGNLWQLYVNLNDDDPGAPTGGYRTAFIGAQKNGIEQNFKDGKLTITITDIFNAVFEAVDFNNLTSLYLKNSSFETSQHYYDCMSKASGNVFFKGAIPDDGEGNVNGWYFWWYSVEELEDYLITLSNQIYQKFTRDTSKTINILFPAPHFYEQYYNNTNFGSYQNEITDKAYLYFIGHIANTTDKTSSSLEFSGGALLELAEDYNNLWDYITDLYKGELQHPQFMYDITSTVTLLANAPFDYASYTSINTNHVWDIEFEPHSEVQGTITASNVEYKEKDHASIELVEQNTRSGNDYQMPIIWHNNPLIDENMIWVSEDNRDTFTHLFSIDCYGFYSKKNHVYQIFYKDRPDESGYITSGDVFIRVANFCELDIASADTTGTIISNNSIGYGITHIWADTVQSASTSLTTANNKTDVTAKWLLDKTKWKYNSKIKAKTDLNTNLNYQTGLKLIGGWFYPDSIQIPISDLAPSNNTDIFDNFSSYWNVTKVNIDFKTEIVEFEAVTPGNV